MDGRWEGDLRFVWGGEFFLFFGFCFLDIYTNIPIYVYYWKRKKKKTKNKKQANIVLF